MARLVRMGDIKDQIPVGGAKMVEVEGKQIAIFNVAGTYHAIDELCTHRAGPLSEGEIRENVVTCPWHRAQFDVTTGKCLKGPAAKDVACYPIKVEGNTLLIEMP